MTNNKTTLNLRVYPNTRKAWDAHRDDYKRWDTRATDADFLNHLLKVYETALELKKTVGMY
jgi:hypothetical protein